MKIFLAFALIFNLVFAFEETQYNEIGIKEAFEKKDEVILLDVREPSEYKAGHINGAIFIPLRELEEKIDMYASDKMDEIIIYCRSGHRSLSAVEKLKNLGFEDVKSMKGGIMNWIKNKYPIER